MDINELIEAAADALGVTDLVLINSGGQKFVLSGRLEGDEVIVKLVELPADSVSAAHVLERASREVELLAAIDSARFVKVMSDAIEIGDRPDAVCWVEERLDGEDLAASIGGSEWTEGEVLALISDLAEGLEACHALDVVHRDLSPGNVRKLQSGRFTIMDPGLARHLAREGLTGVFQPGTRGFMSPEHVPAGNPIPASDVFGVGVLAYLAVTARLPVDPAGATEDEYYRQLSEEQVPSVAEQRSDLDAGLVAVIDRALQRQPARRFLDASELRAAIAELELGA